jgi:hypothetical protein
MLTSYLNITFIPEKAEISSAVEWLCRKELVYMGEKFGVSS